MQGMAETEVGFCGEGEGGVRGKERGREKEEKKRMADDQTVYKKFKTTLACGRRLHP